MKRIIFFIVMLISLAGKAQITLPGRSTDNTRQPGIRIDANSIDTGALTIRAISPVNASSTELRGPLKFQWQLEGLQHNSKDATYTLSVYKFTRYDKPEEFLRTKPFYRVEGITETSHLSKILFDDPSAIYGYRLELINSKGETIASSQLAIFYFGPVVPFPFKICWMLCTPQNINRCVTPSTGVIPISVPAVLIIGCSGTITYSVNGGSSYTPIPPSGNFPVAAFQAGANTLTFKLTCSCDPTSQFCTYQVNIFPQITATADKTEICRGEGAKLSINPFPLPAGYEVNWDWADVLSPWNNLGSGNGKNTNPILPNCAAGVPSVTRYFRPSITSLPGLTPWPAACIQPPASINVWCPTQAGTITATPTPGYCSNNQTFTLNYTGGIGQIVNWKENGIPLNITSPSLTRTKTPGNYTYEVIVQNGTCATSSASLTINVEAPLTAVITGNTTEVCPNGSAVLQLTSPVPPGATIKWEYQVECTGTWINSGVTGPTQNSNNIGTAGPYSPPPANKLCWRAKVSSALGICPPVTSNVWTINIIQAPCVPVITTTGTLPKCPGSPVTLTASSCGTPPLTYKWYLDGMYVGSGITWNAVLPGEYTVEVFNKNNCESRLSKKFTVADCINIITITGPCNVLPSTPIQLCATVSSQPGTAPCSAGLTYLWSSSTGPGSTPTQSCNKWNPAPTVSTTYNVVVKNSMGCTTSASLTVKICQ